MSDPVDEEVDSSQTDASFRTTVRSGFKFSMLNTIAGRVWTLTLGLLLARILDIEDFGVYAVALASLAVLQSMNELGTTVAIIRWQGDPLTPARTATTIALVTSAALYLVAFIAAPAIASGLGSDEATGVIRLLLIGVLLDGVSGVPSALLTRAFQQRRKLVADVAGLVAGGTVTLSLAVAGEGPWALAWGSLTGNAVASMFVLWLAPALPRPGFDRGHAAELLRIGLPLAGASLLLGVMLNIDYIVIGYLLDPVALGLYLLAFNLSSWPPNLLTGAMRQVTLPAFARLSAEPPVLTETFLRWLRIVMTIAIGVAALLGALAGPTIRFVYGQRWAPAAGALAFLAALGAIRILVDLCYDLLVAVGRTRVIMAIQCAWVSCLFVAVWIGASRDGIRGAAAGHVIVGVAVVVPLFLAAVARAGIAWPGLMRALFPPLVAGSTAAVVARLLDSRIASDVGSLLVAGSLGALVFLAIAVPRAGWSAASAMVRARSFDAAQT